MVITKGEFKGNKTISLKKDESEEGYGFTFGIGKAKLILENIQEIEAFVKENEPGE